MADARSDRKARAARPQCFVVMPFSHTPMRDGTNRLYGFDKDYRVIMQPAATRHCACVG